MAMPRGFAELIRRKYDIMQQAQDTTRMGTEAAANLDRVRAGLLPGESRANIGKLLADTGLTNVQAREFAPTAAAQRGLWGTQGAVNKAEVGRIGADTLRIGADTRRIGVDTQGMMQLNELNDIGTNSGRMASVLFPREQGEGAIDLGLRRLRSMYGGY